MKRQAFRGRRLSVAAIPALVATVVLMVAACSSSSSSTTSSNSAASASKTLKHEKIAFIQLQSSPLTSQMDLGADLRGLAG